MRSRKFFVSPILVYVVGQVAWMALLGLWITWYLANVISGREQGGAAAGHGGLDLTTTVFILGLVFLSALLAGLTLIFISFAQQASINRTYDSFLASVTHELKSPLASIRLHLETLSLRNLGQERAGSLVALMIRDTGRLEKLINTILEIASFEQRGQVRKFAPQTASDLVPRLVGQTMSDFHIADWSIETGSCEGARLHADPVALKRVFDVLVDNSVKYSVGATSLRVRCFVRRNRLIVEFTDRGIGIPKESLRKVFRKFYRVERPANPTVTGTGLGLYWAREIVRIHRGTIVAESGGVSCGTLFRISLPLSRNAGRAVGVQR